MSSPTTASSKKKLVTGYDERFVVCRSGQHRWPPYTEWHWKVTTGLRRRPLAYRLTLLCEICGTIARDTIDANTGEKQRSYRWPDGYRIPSDADVSRTDLRLEMLHRLAVNAEPDEEAKAQ